MKRNTTGSAEHKDVALAKRYGKIGIPAVAAAARYQAKGENGQPPALRSGGKHADARKAKETSWHRR